MNARARIRQCELALESARKAVKSGPFGDYVRHQADELVVEVLERELAWLKQGFTPGCKLGEGGVYSLPLRFIGGANNLRFELPDGTEILLAVGAQKFLNEIAAPTPVEKQTELVL